MMNKLPRTKHDLEKFAAVDAFILARQYLCFSIHGTFTERNVCIAVCDGYNMLDFHHRN